LIEALPRNQIKWLKTKATKMFSYSYMPKLQISRGYRKYLRQKKAEIRRRVFDMAEQERHIKELYKDILKEFQNPNF
jgi:hypothetical protein